MVQLSRREVLALLGAGAGFGLASAARGDVGLAAAPLQPAASAGKVAFPKDAVIRTLLKDMSPDTLGNAATLFHEHLSFEWARVRGPNARGNLTGPAKDVNPVLEQLDAALSEGVGCIVDAGTDDVGRDVGFLEADRGADARSPRGVRRPLHAADVSRRMSRRSPRIRLPTIWCGTRVPRDTERSARSERLRMRR